MANVKLTDGKDYALVHSWGRRAIIDYEGTYVMVDQVDATTYELSGEPARPGPELEMLNSLVKDGTTVVVTAPDGSKTTYEDP
jgi:hypothetical protein